MLMILLCVFVFFLPPGNAQNIQTEARGAHQPANDMQQFHQQAEKMPERPTVQYEQVRTLCPSLNPFHAHLYNSCTQCSYSQTS